MSRLSGYLKSFHGDAGQMARQCISDQLIARQRLRLVAPASRRFHASGRSYNAAGRSQKIAAVQRRFLSPMGQRILAFSISSSARYAAAMLSPESFLLHDSEDVLPDLSTRQ